MSRGDDSVWDFLYLHQHQHQEDSLLLPVVGEAVGPPGALLNQSQDFPPPRHYTTAHSSCGSTFLMFNFSPLIPAIIIMVIIIYGVLTEGSATRQIKRCCDTCLQLLRLPPPPPFVLEDSERLFYPLLGLGWVFTGQSFSRAWVCST